MPKSAAAPVPAFQPKPEPTAAPGTAASAFGIAATGGERAAVEQMAREIIEKIAWEVVPELAERIIREHLDRLLKK